ncbi:MAG: hypothetical protein ACPGWM_06390 [Flavobacteriales bacterium]
MANFTAQMNSVKQLRLFVFLALLFVVLSAQSQDNYSSGGARYRGLNGTGLALGSHWSSMQNQAGMVDLKGLEAGVFAFNRFALSELTTVGFSAAMPREKQAYGLSFESYGFSGYRRSQLGVAFAMKLAENFDAGVQLAYHHLQLAGTYGSTGNVTVALGFRYKLMEDLVLAGHIYNPTRSKLADFNSERIPTIFRTGFSWSLAERVKTNVEVQKSIDDPMGVNVGLEYQAMEQLYLRAGAGTKPDLFSFGAGLNTKSLRIDVAASYHQVLGVLPHISLTYHAK